MSEKTLVIDKSKWIDGPWKTEPDRIEWEHSGFPCLMSRHPSSGHWCGYVAVPPGHPCYEKNYSAPWNSDEPEANWPTSGLEAHGGLTYSDHCNGLICHVPKPGEPDNVWWLGFDMAHSGDFSPGHAHRDPIFGCRDFETYKDAAYVTSEVNSLADQLRAMVK